jgi:hypothetical protein
MTSQNLAPIWLPHWPPWMCTARREEGREGRGRKEPAGEPQRSDFLVPLPSGRAPPPYHSEQPSTQAPPITKQQCWRVHRGWGGGMKPGGGAQGRWGEQKEKKAPQKGGQTQRTPNNESQTQKFVGPGTFNPAHSPHGPNHPQGTTHPNCTIPTACTTYRARAFSRLHAEGTEGRCRVVETNRGSAERHNGFPVEKARASRAHAHTTQRRTG